MSAFLIYILKVALLTAAFVLLYNLLFRRDTFFGTARTVLVSSLVMAYILPFCVITIHKPVMASDSSVEQPEQFPQVLATIPYSNQEHPVVQQVQNQIQAHQPSAVLPETKHRQIDWTLIAIVIYAAGVLSLITIRLMSVLKVTGIIRRGRVVMEKDGCKVIASNDNIRPFSWMRYIVLPESYANLSWTSPVIRHEYSHISHHHSAELLATDILSAFQWFNPAVWLLRHDLCCVQEFQADASVLESGLDKTEYGQSLLNLATGGVSVPFVNGLSESNLRARIRMMNRKLSRKANLLKLIYLPVVILVSLLMMSNTVYDDKTNYWDSYTDVTPGIKSIVENNDNGVTGTGSKTTYNSLGMQTEKYVWGKQLSQNGDTVLIERITRFNYDNRGRLISIDKTDDPYKTTIEYGTHGMYVPLDLRPEAVDGEIVSIEESRLIRNISSVIFSYQDGKQVKHLFMADGNKLLHKYSGTSNEGEQIIECNTDGYPCKIQKQGGYIGPITYQQNGVFERITMVRDQTETINGMTTVFSFIKGANHIEKVLTTPQGGNTRIMSYSYNVHGDVERLVSDDWNQDWTYEYDSIGNWTYMKSSRTQYGSEMYWTTIRMIEYYNNKGSSISSQEEILSKDEYQKLLSQSYLLTPDTLLTREKLDIQNNWQISSPGETTQQTKNDSIITYIDIDVKNGDVKSLVEREQFKEATDRFSSKLSYNEDGTVSLSDNTTSQDIQISPEFFEMFNEVIDIYNNGVKETDSVMALDGTDANREDVFDPANSIDELFENDGIVTNNKAYKGYLNFIRISNSVYEFWIVGVADKGGKAVTIELGSINYAITFLENLISSYKQGSTIEIKGHSFTGVKGKAYSIPRSDGFDSEPYLVSIKHLKHDLSVLEKRRDRPNVDFDEVGFFTEDNKPDHYQRMYNDSKPNFVSVNDKEDGGSGEKWAISQTEQKIRERAVREGFNGVILVRFHSVTRLAYSGNIRDNVTTYYQVYIPINYDQEKYQAPMTDYQRSLKRSVFKRNK